MAEDSKGVEGEQQGGSPGKAKVPETSDVPEKAEGQLNPSSPGDTGTTPGTNAPIG